MLFNNLQPSEHRTAPDSHVKYDCSTPSETKERLSHLHQEARKMKEEITAVTVKLENFSENCEESFDAQTTMTFNL